MPNPWLSVIMGVYNCPSKEMLLQAVNSILNQTYKDFEFIICDDGSTDDTLKWLKEKAAEDKRIIIIENLSNRGLAEALNACLKIAKGKFIARQDIDDYSAQTRFQIQIDFLRNHKNIAFVGTDCFLYDKNGIYGERHMPKYPSKKDFLFNSPFVHGTTMFRREVFDKCGGYRLIGKCHKCEDYDFFIRAYANGFQGANIEQLLYTFYSMEKKNLVSAQMRIDEYKVRKNGFKKLGLLPKGAFYVIKPIVLIFVPNKLLNIMKDYRKNKLLNKQSLVLKIYKVAVNRSCYIKFNYERFVNTNRALHSRFPFISWMYLIKLNFESFLFNKETREEERSKSLKNKESSLYSAEAEIANRLCKNVIVSFDIFDTLIFRPFAIPSDLFYFVGEKLNYPDFKTIRIEAERKIRRLNGGEVTLKEIYDFIDSQTGIDSKIGMQTEMDIEYDLCTANPYMKKVWELVKDSGKKIILTSDMYLPSDFLKKLLERNGYTGYDEIFVSCECGCGKYNGRLYEYIKKYLRSADISHIGDNTVSDVREARKHGINAIEYKNVNSAGNFYRPKNMSPIIGSAYSGITNSRLYRGDMSYSPAYEYGFKYGGLLILGFCRFIHKIAAEKKIDKLLFFSRDGYIVKKIYDKLYPKSNTEYIYWSRNAAAKLGANLFIDNFIKRFITQKINHGILIYDVMSAIGISDWEFPFNLNECLNSHNAEIIERFILNNWGKLIETYCEMDIAARQYFEKVLGGCKRVITVDCGWAGSGNIILEQIVNRKWNMNCEFTGLLAGSNSYSQYDSDYSETFFLNEKMAVYCFSSSLNRDKYISHLPSAKHNVYFEMLFSAPEPSFREFALSDDGKCKFIFDNECENKLYIEQIQKGETDFISEYISVFEKYPFMKNISGSDAYAPFMDAMKHSKKYIDKIFSKCVFDELTNGKKEKIKQ